MKTAERTIADANVKVVGNEHQVALAFARLSNIYTGGKPPHRMSGIIGESKSTKAPAWVMRQRLGS